MECMDNQNAADMAFRIASSPAAAEAFLKYCFLAARDHVALRFPEIEAVAAALLERKTLTFDEVRTVIAAAR